MNRTAAFLLGAAVLFALPGCGAGQTSPSMNANEIVAKYGPAQVVNVTAENFKWVMDKTTFQAGHPIEFDLQGKDGMHGFFIDGTSVSKPIGANQTQKVVWMPPKAGTYTIRCNIFCGSGHGSMATQFQVQ